MERNDRNWGREELEEEEETRENEWTKEEKKKNKWWGGGLACASWVTSFQPRYMLGPTEQQRNLRFGSE